MLQFILRIAEQYGYFGILFLIFLENIFPPIPSEIILPLSGFLTTKTNLGAVGVVVAATIGSVAGAILLYIAGGFFNQERLERLVHGRLGRMLHFKMDQIQKAQKGFQEHGSISVLFLRCVPIVRSLISIPAGMAQMPLPRFLLYTSIGSLVWNILLISLGILAGESWSLVSYYIDLYSTVVEIILALFLISLFVRHYNKK